MKKMLKKVSCVGIMLLMIVKIIVTPSICYAEMNNSEYVDVIRGSAPLRTEPYRNGDVVVECDKGAVLKYEGALCNRWNNSWYIVSYNGSEYYIYSENVTMHECDYSELYYNGVTYSYCTCGKINILETEIISIKRANTIAMYAVEAVTAAAVDGPVPAGDVIGAAILVLGAADSVLNGVTETTVTVAKELDLDEILENKNTCSENSFRKVTRTKGEGKLTYTDDECMDVLQAFFYARFIGDTYTYYELNAYEEASFYGACFSERDAERPEYWYHYHFGNDHKNSVGFHMFYGTNDYGEVPIEP